jgi:hypothetical protein
MSVEETLLTKAKFVRDQHGKFAKGNHSHTPFPKGEQSSWSPLEKGQHLSRETEFKAGMIPWNKGLHNLSCSALSSSMDNRNTGNPG